MFKINKLKISGFKSFPYPKEIDISEGITGVIGPNGCGKSNIFEAIRWVMGEGSSKSLRSNSMDEVIFSGTEKLPAKNFAEVSMEIQKPEKNNEKLLITRSIQRGVGTFFKINNKDVRAKDVSILFTDSGSGPRSSSIISQGNIDQIINFKPLERKIILEDAAGISGLQARRRDSELKLMATEKNLERLNDITQNLERQMLSLKRQARQAENYQNITDKISENEQCYYYLKWYSFEKEIFANNKKLKSLKINSKKLLNSIQEIESKKKSEVKNLDEYRLKISNLDRLLNEKRISKNELENKKNNIELRTKEILDYIHTFNQDMDSEKKRLNEIQENMSKVQKNLDSMEIPKKLINSLKSLKQDENNLTSQISEIESKLFSEMQLTLGEEFKKDNLRETLSKLRNKEKVVSTEIRKLEYEIRIKEKKFKEKKSKEIEKKVQYLQENLKKKQKKYKIIEARNIFLIEEKEKIGNEIEQISNNLTKHTTERETFKKIAGNINYSKESIFKLIRIKKGYEKAIYTALNYELDAELKESPKRWEFRHIKNLSALPNKVESLVKFVEAPKEVIPLLSQCGLVENKADGFKYQKVLNIGQYLVSKTGESWRWDGLYCEKETEISKISDFQIREEKLDNIIVNDRIKLTEKDKKKKLLVSETENNLKEFSNLKRDIENLHENIDNEKKSLVKFQQEKILEKNLIEKLNERKKFISIEFSKLSNEINHLSNQQKASKKEISKRESSEQRNLEKLLKDLKKELIRKKDSISNLNKKILSIEIKSKYWHNYMEENIKRKSESDAHLNSLFSRIKALEKEKKIIHKDPKIYESDIKLLEIDINTIFSKQSECVLKQDNLKNKISEYEKDIKKLTEEKLSLNNDIIRTEENFAFNKDNQNTISKEIQKKYKVLPHKLVVVEDLKDVKNIQIEDYEKEINQLKVKRDLIGPVNLRAKIEEKEISDELLELTSERDDILLAIKKLRNSIQNINTEGRNRLIKAFEKVNNNFSTIFTKLFAGGQANLELVGSDDPLQTGIEILARPPGKKLTSINLLSGGEKALTAISLIFSIFLINPSPICILDEVDAALDDSNVEKFCKILREIKNQTSTKFLIITHHKTTMSMVDRIYGVTMMQKGISDLVKVDFEQKEFKEAI